MIYGIGVDTASAARLEKSIASTFSCLQFCLNVHQQIDLRQLCLCDHFLSWGMRFLPRENCLQIFQSISFAQAVHSGGFLPTGELQAI